MHAFYACPSFRQDVHGDRRLGNTFVKQDFLCTFVVHKRSFFIALSAIERRMYAGSLSADKRKTI